MSRWMITGSNGNLGKLLIRRLLADEMLEDERQKDEAHEVVAVVRSERARQTVAALADTDATRARLSVRTLSYTDVAALREAAAGCDRVVHLVGILKETRAATYADAHEHSTQALVDALSGAGAPHVTYLSIVGSAADAQNRCLRSKGHAETILLHSDVNACVLRVPMVLGPGDYASFALARRARSSLSFGFRMSSLEQPIFANDVVEAIVQAGDKHLSGAHDLGGPEVLTRAELTQRAAGVLGLTTRTVSLPIGLGYALTALLGLLPEPPLTRDMLEVLDHDDNVDSAASLQALALGSLTSLDDMLAAVLPPS